jgi:hypothetical protein
MPQAPIRHVSPIVTRYPLVKKIFSLKIFKIFLIFIYTKWGFALCNRKAFPKFKLGE